MPCPTRGNRGEGPERPPGNNTQGTEETSSDGARMGEEPRTREEELRLDKGRRGACEEAMHRGLVPAAWWAIASPRCLVLYAFLVDALLLLLTTAPQQRRGETV